MTTLLTVRNVSKYFPIQAGFASGKEVLRAVNGVDLEIRNGETFGLVGESGCGKTTLARLILRLIEPTAGSVYFMGSDIFRLRGDKLRGFRRQAQLICQNPFAALNPRKTIRKILFEPYVLHERFSDPEMDENVSKLLEVVGLSPASLYINRFPHELSGGQRQRVVIARAIALNPQFIVADEPVSSLDVSLRAQLLNLMKSLQRDYRLTYLFITHDLSVVRSFCVRIAIMYLGKLVELADVENIFGNPLHPYTELLLASTPIPDPEASRKRKQTFLEETAASLERSDVGCEFYPRCPIKIDKCCEVKPELVDVGDGHQVSCPFRASVSLSR